MVDNLLGSAGEMGCVVIFGAMLEGIGGGLVGCRLKWPGMALLLLVLGEQPRGEQDLELKWLYYL